MYDRIFFHSPQNVTDVSFFVVMYAKKMEVGLRSHITSTKQVCENKQSSIEVHSVVWPPSERDV